MKLISAERELRGFFHRPVMTLGNFDGVHCGHQQLFLRVCEEARNAGVSSVVYTFDPHPLCVLNPRQCPPMITSHRQRIDLIAELGIQFVIVARFTRHFAAQSAWDFLENIIHQQIGPQKIIIGENFNFGRNREGNSGMLADSGRAMEFKVESVSPIMREDTVISSTVIRNYLLRGEVLATSRLLGRRYEIRGKVIPGRNYGRTMGYPTANIHLTDGLCPAEGVYAVRLAIENGLWSGVLSIGINPTFGDRPLSIEAHIFEFEGNLYGKEIKVFFVERLRDNVRFASKEALSAQIKQDIARSKEILAQAG